MILPIKYTINTRQIIMYALYRLGVLEPGERPSEDEKEYCEAELAALLAALHLELAQRLALRYKVHQPSPIIATENATDPRSGDKPF